MQKKELIISPPVRVRVLAFLISSFLLIKMQIIIAVLLTVLTTCQALQPILPEQLGETDWKIDSLAGTIQRVIEEDDHVFVSTSESEIARLNKQGEFDWFAKVSDSQVSNLAIFQRGLFTFSKNDNLVRMWNAGDGSLLWEVFLGFRPVGVDTNSVTNIAVDSANDMVTVLSDNCLHFIGFHGGLVWKWCATDAGKLTDSEGEDNTRLVLSHLLAPSGGAAGAAQKVAVGCVTGVSAQDGTELCRNTMVLVIDQKDRGVFMDSFVGLSSPTAPSALRGALQQGGKGSSSKSYGDEDVIFSAHAHGLDITHLASDTTYSVPVPVGEDVEAMDITSVSSFVLMSDKVRKPAFKVCTAKSCRVLVSSGFATSVKISTVVHCEGVGVTVGTQQHSMSSSPLVTDVGCGYIHRAPVSSSSSELSLVIATASTKNDLLLPPSYWSSLTGDIVNLFPLSGGTSLVAASAGLVLMAHPSGIKWHREHAISHISQVLVLDRIEAPAAGASESSSDSAASGNDVIPTLQERFDMQKEEVMHAYKALLESLQHPGVFVSAAVNTVLDVVVGMLHPQLAGLIKVPKAAAPVGGFAVGANDVYFGFNKLAVCLTLTPVPAASNGLSKVRIVGVEFASREVVWSYEPDMPAVDSASTYTALLQSDVKSVGGTDHFELLVSDSTDTRVYSVQVATHVTADSNPVSVQTRSLYKHMVPGARVIMAMEAAVSSGLDHSKHFVLLQSNYDVLYYTPMHTVHALVKSGLAKSDAEMFNQLGSQYVHAWGSEGDTCTVDIKHNNGVLQIVRVDGSSCKVTDTVGVSTCSTEPVSSLNFDKEREAVYSISHLSSDEAVHSRTIALGDDSLLLKALNPNTILITSFTPAQAAEPYADLSYVSTSTTVSDVDGSESTKRTLELLPSSLYVTLVDAVSGKVLHRTEIEGATAPVHAHLLENNVMISYWNAVAKRTELVSMSLYEGMVDKYALVPGANKPAITRTTLNPDGSRSISAYQLTPPVVQSKTFILPRAVTAMSHSVTARGISHKNLLLGLNTHQLHALDMRHVSTRRPVNAPTPAEKEEGLFQYQPFLQFVPTNMITYNYSLLGPVTAIHSYPTALESSSIVFATTTNGVFCNRIETSNKFDTMPSDFNDVLLVVVLIGMSLGVMALRHYYRQKKINSQWG